MRIPHLPPLRAISRCSVLLAVALIASGALLSVSTPRALAQEDESEGPVATAFKSFFLASLDGKWSRTAQLTFAEYLTAVEHVDWKDSASSEEASATVMLVTPTIFEHATPAELTRFGEAFMRSTAATGDPALLIHDAVRRCLVVNGKMEAAVQWVETQLNDERVSAYATRKGVTNDSVRAQLLMDLGDVKALTGAIDEARGAYARAETALEKAHQANAAKRLARRLERRKRFYGLPIPRLAVAKDGEQALPPLPESERKIRALFLIQSDADPDRNLNRLATIAKRAGDDVLVATLIAPATEGSILPYFDENGYWDKREFDLRPGTFAQYLAEWKASTNAAYPVIGADRSMVKDFGLDNGSGGTDEEMKTFLVDPLGRVVAIEDGVPQPGEFLGAIRALLEAAKKRATTGTKAPDAPTPPK